MLSKRVFREIILLAILVCLFLVVPLGADPLILWGCLGVFYWYFFRSFKDPISIVPGIETYFKMDLLFLMFYYLLLYYPYQTYVLGSHSILENTWIAKSYVEYSNKAIIASTIGLVAFMMGFTREIKIKKVSVQKRDFSQHQYKVLYVKILLVTLAFVALFYIKGGMVMLTGSYLGSRTKDPMIDGLYTLLSVFVSVLAGFTIVYYKKYRSINFYMAPALMVFLFYSYLTLVGGDRNTFFIVAIAAAGAYYSYIKSISKKMLVFYLFLALALYQVIEISRTAEDRSLGAIVAVISGSSQSSAPTQVGDNVDQGSFSITNLVTRAAFYFVPNKDEHTYGKYLVIGFAGFIPYARGAIVDPRDPDQSSSFYMTRVNGSGFGLGSSIIMDSYIEFGLFGILFFPYILGWLGKYMQAKAQSGLSIKWGVVYLLALGTYAEISRYTFDFIIKNIGWALLIFIFFELLVRARGKVPVVEETTEVLSN